MPANIGKCENCAYWASDTLKRGECHRRAPVAVSFVIAFGEEGDADQPVGKRKVARTLSNPSAMAGWPPTGRNDWCGEWAPSSGG